MNGRAHGCRRAAQPQVSTWLRRWFCFLWTLSRQRENPSEFPDSSASSEPSGAQAHEWMSREKPPASSQQRHCSVLMSVCVWMLLWDLLLNAVWRFLWRLINCRPCVDQTQTPLCRFYGLLWTPSHSHWVSLATADSKISVQIFSVFNFVCAYLISSHFRLIVFYDAWRLLSPPGSVSSCS